MLTRRTYAILRAYLDGQAETEIAEQAGVKPQAVRRQLNTAFDVCPGLEWAADVVRTVHRVHAGAA